MVETWALRTIISLEAVKRLNRRTYTKRKLYKITTTVGKTLDNGIIYRETLTPQ